MMRPALALLVVCLGCASAKSGAGGGDPDAKVGSGTPDGPGVTAPDANSCAHQPCSLSPQCGCAAGMACDLDDMNLATGGTACRAAGPGTEATTCNADAQCKAGTGCIGGRCRPWCNGDTDCTSGSGALCVIQVVFGTPSQDVPGAKVCTTDCDPTSKAPAGCPATWGCHIYQEQDGAKRLLTDCDAGGAGGAGASCMTNGSSDCQPGMDCINVTRGTVTTAECHPSCLCPSGNCAAGSCPAGTGSCGAFSPKVTIGTREYGTCL
jgi:hypothetical protein